MGEGLRSQCTSKQKSREKESANKTVDMFRVYSHVVCFWKELVMVFTQSRVIL